MCASPQTDQAPNSHFQIGSICTLPFWENKIHARFVTGHVLSIINAFLYLLPRSMHNKPLSFFWDSEIDGHNLIEDYIEALVFIVIQAEDLLQAL